MTNQTKQQAITFQRIAARSYAVARDLADRGAREARIFGGYSPLLKGAVDHQRHAAEFAALATGSATAAKRGVGE